MNTKSLYVGNLSYDTTEDGLRKYFEKWGPVTDVRLIERRGFGFVELPTEKAQEAIDSTNGTDLDGRTLTVNEARPRGEQRDGRGRRDSGNRGHRW